MDVDRAGNTHSAATLEAHADDPVMLGRCGPALVEALCCAYHASIVLASTGLHSLQGDHM
jgi:hypothetical protein